MSQPLAADFTLQGLTSPPGERERFCRKVLGVMSSAQKEFGVVHVRFGRMGTGIEPNYRLETVQGRPLRAYNGASHGAWPKDGRFDGTETWSSVAMTYEEVQVALASFIDGR